MMKGKSGTTREGLRQRAEQAIAQGLHSDLESFAHIKDYVHELQVYQAELEMQADELRRTQAELEASRDEYSELYDCAPVGYMSINHTGVILRVNETVAAMLAVDREALIRKPLSRYISPGDHTLFFAVCQKAAYSERFRTCELCFLRTGSQEFYGRLDLVPVSGERFIEPHYRVTLVDITDRKKAELEKLRLEREVLKSQKDQSLKRLAGGIAHNFNNILTACIGNIELLRDLMWQDEQREIFLERLHHSTLKAAELSTMMLQYLGQSPPKGEVLELVERIGSLQSVLRSTITGEIQLSYQPTAGPVYVRVDPAQMAQIFNNLIANSAESIGNGPGTITVRLYQGFFNGKNLPPSPHGELLKAGEYACLEVIDTGCGMDGETLLHAIDPFFTTNFTGRGLGLSAVWGTVHAHHGYLYMESEVHKGTSVKVFLPIFRPDILPAGLRTEPYLLEGLKGRMVLYVDDDSIVRTIGRLLLEEIGAVVIEAEDGLRAVEIFRRHRRDIACVILDFAMPGQDGNLTLNALRRIDPGIKVLLVSGYLKDHTVDTFQAQQPNGFLQKPFDRERFHSALREVLDFSYEQKN